MNNAFRNVSWLGALRRNKIFKFRLRHLRPNSPLPPSPLLPPSLSCDIQPMTLESRQEMRRINTNFKVKVLRYWLPPLLLYCAVPLVRMLWWIEISPVSVGRTSLHIQPGLNINGPSSKNYKG